MRLWAVVFTYFPEEAVVIQDLKPAFRKMTRINISDKPSQILFSYFVFR